MFVYPGDQRYFSGSSLASYDAEATALLTARVLDFLAELSPIRARAYRPGIAVRVRLLDPLGGRGFNRDSATMAWT